ncbi:succinate-semialdehyde dehydrogenase (NADP(+)) [Natronomonas salina]|uniref:succinic semialdehyde dehydrogenase n=1 Tax=Natronomonas salina TaxID=1710540 RepID=UPI0015B4B917|nr:succinic semialdehyde dehydrogenase [Natronomonas salina]QLD88166.1 succinate-semialdehyde dehydrogenase (NADP(+)) [Natronomonas salina]
MTVSESAAEAELEVEAELLAGLESGVTTAGAPEERFDVEAPFRGTKIGDLPACGPDDVEVAFERARQGQEAWERRSVAERAEVFKRYHDLVIENCEELLDIVQLESGKARRHAYEEVLDVAMTARHYAYRAEDYLESEEREGALPGLTETEVHHHPVGVVGMITPWNYPLSLAVSDAIPALLAGNSVVIKPAEQTSYTALKAIELLREAGLPRDVFRVVTGHGKVIGEPLVAESDFVCFTGSTETGRIVASQAGEHLTKCSMELGGKNPGIVCDDADVDRAVEGLIRGCFTNAGQLCISIERLYVHEDVYGQFVEAFVDAIEGLHVGAGYDHDVDVGSLISEEQLEKVTDHVEEAKAQGATVLTGGTARPDLGPYFYEPTVLTDVDESMTLCANETFGPVVAVYEWSDEDDVIERANDSDYGLNASIWTEDHERGREMATQIETGTVNVNEGYAAAWASLDAPMGGMKNSGIGRRHGDEGIMKYTESQTVSVQKHLGMTNPPGVPHWLYAKLMNKTLKIQRHIPGMR